MCIFAACLWSIGCRSDIQNFTHIYLCTFIDLRWCQHLSYMSFCSCCYCCCNFIDIFHSTFGIFFISLFVSLYIHISCWHRCQMLMILFIFCVCLYRSQDNLETLGFWTVSKMGSKYLFRYSNRSSRNGVAIFMKFGQATIFRYWIQIYIGNWPVLRCNNLNGTNIRMQCIVWFVYEKNLTWPNGNDM